LNELAELSLASVSFGQRIAGQALTKLIFNQKTKIQSATFSGGWLCWEEQSVIHSVTKEGLCMASEQEIIANQNLILSHLNTVIENQETIKENQETIKSNQEKLDALLANQETIQANQAKILANQTEIMSLLAP
jgi:hypothetical protein